VAINKLTIKFMKRLMFLISTEGKTLEEMEESVSKAMKTYQTTSEKVKQEISQEERERSLK